MDEKNVPARIPNDFFYSCVFWRIFLQERVFGEVAGIPVVWGIWLSPHRLKEPKRKNRRDKEIGIDQIP